MRRGIAALTFGLVGLLGAPGADAKREMMAKPMRRRPTCNAGTLEAITACLKTAQPSWRVLARPSPHTMVVGDPGRAAADRDGWIYVQSPGGAWQHIENEDAFTKIVGEVAMTVNQRPAVRVELRKVEPIGERAVLRMKSAIVCTANAGCSVLPYDCSSLQDGRATGIVKGAIEVQGDDVVVVGDRTRAGGYCSI